jgi:excisionase family DNA binding protein
MDLMKVSECAAEARVSKMTIYRLIDDGYLAHVRVGKSIRVYREDWDAYLKGARWR